MRPIAILGVVLILLGIAALILQGITYTAEEQVLEVGPIEATAERERTIPLPPIAGAVAVVAGLVLVYLGRRRR